MSLVTHRPSLWVVGQKLRVKHLEARLALRPRIMTTTTTSRVLGEAYRLFQKARRDLHRQTLPSPKLRQLSKSWRDFVEQGDGALRNALVRVLEQTLQRRELADAHLLRELQICKDKLPEDGKACSFCSSTPGSTDVPARCAHQDRDRDADRPGLYAWIRTVANDPSAPAGLLLALHDEVSRSSIAISW